ncbi:class I SAM-dependent methyltransferase [Dactylosporangium salmoneum]|uniref:Class I SAM-dependent methyltransferase n=1 Tax=Dactylosporangium salmoneum TaxID=53361 RepID=A0ABN3FJZ4_9ACTN
MDSFERLVAEAVAVPLQGWDFSWLDGRAEGSQPSWSYPALARELLRDCAALLDIDTGGGEFLASLAPLPARTTAIEGWPPNVPVARDRLAPLGAEVRFAPGATLPVESGSVDVVLNRHGRLDPQEVARVLRPGGTLLTQQVGSDDCAAINAALGAPTTHGTAWNAETAAQALTDAGLTVTGVREEWPPFTFFDVGALVYQLRAVPWQVPDFTADRYDAALRRIDQRIRAEGAFRVHAHRFLIQASRPDPGINRPASPALGAGPGGRAG